MWPHNAVLSDLGGNDEEGDMAKTCLRVKSTRTPKFGVRRYFRCTRCGRSRGYLRKFQVCRICFRQLASRGEIPGVVKASW